MRRSTRNAVYVLLVSTLAVAGCGGGSDGDGDPGAADAAGAEEAPAKGACELLTAAEVEGVLGKPGNEPAPRDAGPFSGCEFIAEGAPAYLYASTLYASTSGRTEFEAERKGRKNLAPVSGVGNDAFSSFTSDQTDVTFFVDDRLVTVSLVYLEKRTGDPAADVARITDLAKQAADRI